MCDEIRKSNLQFSPQFYEKNQNNYFFIQQKSRFFKGERFREGVYNFKGMHEISAVFSILCREKNIDTYILQVAGNLI